MSKNTPGPWRVSEQCAQMIDIRHDNNEPGAISLTLARVVARPSWQREAEANARLIAAAPELLEALQAYLDMEQDHHGHILVAFRPVTDLIRAVVAKATGA